MSADEKFALLLEQQTKLLATMQSQITLLQQQVVTNTGDSSASRVNVPWPQPLQVESGDQHENLEFFKNGWQNYCLASGIDKWPPAKAEIKAGLLISALGSAAMKKYMEFGLTEEDKKDEVLIFKKIEEFISKETNLIYSRYLFNARTQLQGEDFSEYLLSLKKLVKPCQYGTMEKEILRDRIVVGIINGDTKKELLRRADLDLEEAVNICRSAETASKQLTELQKTEESEEKSINKINEQKTYQKELRTCKFCGNKHIFNKNICPAYKKRCEKCKGWNHLAKVCKKKYVREVSEQTPSDVSDDDVYISEIKINKRSGHREVPLLFNIENKMVKAYCILDTGSQVCTMGVNYYKTITGCNELTNLEPSIHKLRCFNNSEITDYGTKIFECVSNHKKYSIKFHIVDVDHKPLLSENACLALGLIKYCNTISSRR
ncbi:uncharacterized protein [Choristoneura fumiferana]|uniref:uncharacterized protein n=1 Tax=Choristoneura fumiferana TaxID=7141 RepID=UPI003D15A3C3